MKTQNDRIKIYAPDIEPRMRHKRIFDIFDGLEIGMCLELTNDHDPKPLYYQFLFEREGLFDWKYELDGPTTWRVTIRKR
ncbi:DUF2249 domain-containing protein [Aquibacillus koreensis]|uniref:DUF2249 domain-containing protein n=1 Tax=Aquibacillus koreensis TaxID=279446 RepID=A0A9X3WKQ4_9BACI|nr:DUF2249 domain-containing protein [Aquibacillus koreensis]MCT2535634.1 DUF2249 domain-containing protein [Aquibacillus koreensis]MDC3420081.1 DUF2249 domain-containing protein [Aquibacillus koreensis]